MLTIEKTSELLTIEKASEFEVRSEFEEQLRVERTDISFQDLDRNTVRVQVTVHNVGTKRSRPTVVTLESAPLGAFVPWQPLGDLLVPSLEPGESRELSTDVARPHPAPLGDFNRVPPRTLLTALNAPEQTPRPRRQGARVWLRLLAGGRTARPSVGRAFVAPDIWDLVGREQPHWAGNINVFVGRRPVERHMAKALRIYPGRANLAMFMVGPAGQLAFELVGLSPDWDAALYDVTNNSKLLFNPSDAPIEETRWIEANGGLMVMLVTKPPADCTTGKVEVRVTRRTDRQTAVVEFDLDPAAEGPGCYYV